LGILTKQNLPPMIHDFSVIKTCQLDLKPLKGTPQFNIRDHTKVLFFA